MPTETLAMRAKVRQVPLTNYIIMALSLSRVHLQEFKAGPIDVKTTCKSISPRGGVLPYMAYTGMCRWSGYGFWPLCPKQGM